MSDPQRSTQTTPILDFAAAHEVAAGVPLYEHSDAYCAALEAQAQARLAVERAIRQRAEDRWEAAATEAAEMRQRAEAAEAKLAALTEPGLNLFDAVDRGLNRLAAQTATDVTAALHTIKDVLANLQLFGGHFRRAVNGLDTDAVLRAEHQRLTDAVVEAGRQLSEVAQGVAYSSHVPAKYWRLLHKSVDALAAFEAQHPEVK